MTQHPILVRITGPQLQPMGYDRFERTELLAAWIEAEANRRLRNNNTVTVEYRDIIIEHHHEGCWFFEHKDFPKRFGFASRPADIIPHIDKMIDCGSWGSDGKDKQP